MELTYEGYKLCNFFNVVEAPKDKKASSEEQIHNKILKNGNIVVLCSIDKKTKNKTKEA